MGVMGGGIACRVAVLLSLLVCISSLYEDMVGVNDFHLENLGRIKQAVFHPESNKRRIFVTSHSSFVGMLDARSGGVTWRQNLASDGPIDDMHHSGRVLVTASGGGKFLRMFSAADGLPIWDDLTGVKVGAAVATPLATRNAARDDIKVRVVADVDGDQMEDVALIADNMVQMRSGDSGKSLWKWTSDVRGATLTHVAENGKGALFIVATAPGAAHVVELSASAGTKRGGGALDGAGGQTCAASVLLGLERLACLDAAGGKVMVWELASRRSVSFGISSALNGATALGIRSSGADDVVVVETSAGHIGISVPVGNSGGEAQVTARAGAGGAVAAGVGKGGVSTSVGAALGKGATALKVTVGGGDVSGPASFSVGGVDEASLGAVEQAWASVYARKDGSVGLRVLVSTEGCELVFFQQDKVAWARSEALAYVTHARMVDLPVPAPAHDELMDDSHKGGNPIVKLVSRMTADVSDLVAFAANPMAAAAGTSTGTARAGWDTTGVSLAHDMEGDRFGFAKISVVSSSAGILLGVHSKKGAVVWRKRFETGTTIGPFFVTRSPGTDGNAEVLVVGTSPNGSAFAAAIHPLTGAEVSRTNLPAAVVQAAVLPLRDSHHTQIVALLCADEKVRVQPDTAEVRALVAARAHLTFLYLVDQKRSVMDGYGLAPGGPKGGAFTADKVWTVAFPAGEKIVSFAAQNQDAVVRSAGRVLGDRGVMLKYLNANLVAVATHTSAGDLAMGGASAAPTVRTKEPVLRVYLIDAVQGAIVHDAVHKDAGGPVEMVQSENSLIYSYRNNRKERNEVAVMELFENSAVELKTAAQIMVFNQTTGPRSAAQLEKPRLVSQAYISTVGIKHLAVTETMHGITTKNVLMALSTDQIFSMDKKLLDPRRPVGKPTANDQEEGLVAFSPYLPLAPTSMLTYNQTVFGLRGITVAPAKIESTCLMLAYGTDLFFTRVAPAKTYDCLGEDFNYPSLIAAILILFTATQVVAWYLGRSELNKAWK
mmetsp:Transcript_44347/g.105657  ORF Transcript_44347/g.105657 Transcript_44347/m.105657 type:complete len:1000 (+) Transcript_44347:34-3033(+)